MKYKSERAEPISCSQRRLQSSHRASPCLTTPCAYSTSETAPHSTLSPACGRTQLLPLQSAAVRVILHPASCILPKPQFRTAQPMSVAVLSALSPFNRRRQLNLPIYLNVLHFLQLKLYNMFFTKTLKPSKRPRGCQFMGDANSCARNSGNIWDREHERKHACPCNITSSVLLLCMRRDLSPFSWLVSTAVPAQPEC